MEELSLDIELDRHYSSNKLNDIHKFLLKDFLARNPAIFQEWGLNRDDFSGLSLRKKEIIKLLSILFSDKRAFEQWYNSFPKMMANVFKTIVWEGNQEVYTLNKRAKGDIFFHCQDDSSFIPERINNNYCIFLTIDSKYDPKTGKTKKSFGLPFSIRKKIKAFLPIPKGYNLKAIKSPGPTEFVYENKESILRELPLIFNFIQQKNLKLTKSGIPQSSSLTKLQKYCEVSEFFPAASTRDHKILRINLLVHLVLLLDKSLSSDNPLECLKNIIDNYISIKPFPSLFLLSHIKGWSRVSDSLQENIHCVFFDLLKEMPIGKWISVRQLTRFIMLRDIEIDLIGKEEANQHLYIPDQWKGWGNTKQFITEDIFDRAINQPLTKAMFFLFSSYGLVDLAYNHLKKEIFEEKDKNFITIFDGLRYIRFTELGAYVTDVKKQFVFDIEKNKRADILLDEDRLIIFLSEPDKLVELPLAKFAEKIGRNRYRVSYATFLNGCSSKNDIKIKIQLFKDKISNKLPDIWNDFFEKALLKARPLEALDDVIVYKVSADDAELLQFFSTDEEIRKYILKAENYHIAIKKDDFDKVKHILENQGYLV